MKDALILVEKMTEMGKDDKINKIFSFSVVFLVHLIKQEAEGRSTRSWEVSIRNAVRYIQRSNKCRKAGGYYLQPEELRETVNEAYEAALDAASVEAFEGTYSVQELGERVARSAVIDRAMTLITASDLESITL